MTNKVIFNAEFKGKQGTSASRAVRLDGRIPAIVYGGPMNDKAVSISAPEFEREYKKGGFKTRVMELLLEGKPVLAIAKDIQFHPVSGLPQHIDFQEVTNDSVIRIDVRLRVINEDKCPGLKRGGVVNLVYRSIPLLCPINNIPDHIDVDLTEMQIGQNKHMSEVKLPENVRPYASRDFTIVSIGGRGADDADAAKAEGAAAEAPASK